MTHLQSLINSADKAAVAESNFQNLDTKILRASLTYDFASIGAGASATTTATVTGAAVNDQVILGLPSAPPAGILFDAYVSAANTVTLRATNITGGAIDPANLTYKFIVLRY